MKPSRNQKEKRGTKVFSVLLMMIMLLCQVACSKSGKVTEGDLSDYGEALAQVEITQVGEVIDVPLADHLDWVSGVVADDTYFYVVGQSDEIPIMIKLDSVGNVSEEVSLEKVEDDSLLPLRAGIKKGEGIYVLFGPMNEEDESLYYLGRYDFSGHLVGKHFLAEMNQFMFGPCIGEDNRIVFWNPFSILCCDKAGEVTTVEVPDGIECQSVLGIGDDFYAYVNDSEKGDFGVYRIDIDNGILGEYCLGVSASYSTYMQSCNGRDMGYINTGEQVMSLNDQMDLNPIFTWAETRMDGDVVDCFATYDNNIYACSSAGEQTVHIVPVERAVVDRELVTVGAMRDRSSNLERYVGYFNNNNPKYYVRIKYYDDPTILRTELITGKSVDVIETSSLGIPITDTYFMDIAPYLSGNVAGKNEYVTGLYDAMCVNNKLLMVCDSFEIDTVVGRTESVGKEPGWSMADLYDLSNHMGEGYTIFPEWLTSRELMLWICNVCIGQFIDWNDMTCNFESDEFIQLMKFCKDTPDVYDSGAYSGDYDEHVLLTIQAIQTIEWLNTMKQNYGVFDYTYIGFPNDVGENGSFFALSEEAVLLAIPLSTSNEEGSLAFTSGILTEEWQSRVEGLPVRQTELEERISNYLITEDCALSSDDIDKFTELINETRLYMRFDRTVSEIILEEAQAFFLDDKTPEEVASIIDSRIKNYLEEQK